MALADTVMPMFDGQTSEHEIQAIHTLTYSQLYNQAFPDPESKERALWDQRFHDVNLPPYILRRAGVI